MDEPERPDTPNSSAYAGGAEVLQLPARMINEFVYCPRLAYLEWIQGEWADNADTVEGRFVHRVADRQGGDLPAPGHAEADERIHARSVTLSSEALGVVARLDLVEGDGSSVRPVDYKRGRRPHVEKSAYLPERVQLGLQILLLREHGHTCDEGVLYFVESRERVTVPLDDALLAEVSSAVNGLRLMAASNHIPPPLVDSPKCVRCSLVTICLPDEVSWLRAGTAAGRIEPRPLAVARTDALPLVVQENGARISKDGDTLEIFVEKSKVAGARLAEVSQVAIYGNVSLTTPALHELMRREVPVTWHSYSGWFLGHTAGLGHRNVEIRGHQWRQSFDPGFCLGLARGLVSAKIRNSRTLLRRNWRATEPADEVLAQLEHDRQAAEAAHDLSALLGIEGMAARRYFSAFAQCLAANESGARPFDWQGRNRRPPTDPINALLSFTYAMLTRAWTIQLSAVGLDAYCGFFHQPRFGRPALALDMMEPFRPLIADSAVLLAINNGEVKPADFIERAGAVSLTPSGRKAIIATFERRLDQEITHPVFGYRVAYRRLFEVQARLLARHLAGEIPEFPHITPR